MFTICQAQFLSALNVFIYLSSEKPYKVYIDKKAEAQIVADLRRVTQQINCEIGIEPQLADSDSEAWTTPEISPFGL